MKKMILTGTVVLALAGASLQTARAGDREWATAGKVLTGVAIAGLVVAAAGGAPCNVNCAYSAPVYCPPSAPPCNYYSAPPAAYWPPAVVVQPAPVVYCPPPVVACGGPVVIRHPRQFVRYEVRHGYW